MSSTHWQQKLEHWLQLPTNITEARTTSGKVTVYYWPIWTLFAGISILFLVHYVLSYTTRLKNMPPGPAGLPFIGNQHQMPATKPWRKFEQLNNEYGSVVSLFFGRTPVIVLGTAQAAWDLLEKRSEFYSSRPRFVMAGEILSDNMRGLMLPNSDERWRRWRKLLHVGFHSRQAQNYREIQSLESKQLMTELLEDPKDWERHLQRYAASVVTSVTYGRRVEDVDEMIVRENVKSMDYLISVNLPGKYIVESWPWLLKLPRFMQWFRYEPEQQRQRDIKLLTHLVDDVKARTAAGSIPDCLATQTLANQGKSGMDDVEVAYALSTPFGAGIDTTSATMSSFFLAMLHFPDVMRKAQAELDAVIPVGRMPDFDDIDKLPYTKAVMNETLRWRPVAVLGGQAHASTKDDEYEGMFIPKGSMVFGNLAGITRDPKMFPDPDDFRPERFIETADPRLQNFELTFGFGRRICPGMHLARNSLFIEMARILWGFDITPEIDAKTGKPVIPDPWDYTNGFNSRPVSFECRIIPRSEKVAATIRSEWVGVKTKLAEWM